MPQTHTGPLGEAYVRDRLVQEGYEILAQNHHSRYGEIDIIAKKPPFLAFVEVKTRRSTAGSAGRESVTMQKRRRILMTAMTYLSEHKTDLQPRFDVAEVVTGGDPPAVLSMTYYENAFGAEGMYAPF